MEEMRRRVPPTIAIQGNLDPELLYAPIDVIEKETTKLLHSMEGDPGYIANLGHGVLPDIPVERRAAATAQFLSGYSHLTPEQLEDISGTVLRVLTHPDFAQIFAPGSRAEISLA